jgi:hypothetical protein
MIAGFFLFTPVGQGDAERSTSRQEIEDCLMQLPYSERFRRS